MQRVAAFIGLMLGLAACPGSNGGDCKVDGDCGSAALCARNSECLPASEVRMVRVTWTIRGMPASDATCAQSPDFYLLFAGTAVNDTFGYAPVPCKAGQFTVDKLPRRFVSVEIGEEHGFAEAMSFDANGNVTFDLFP